MNHIEKNKEPVADGTYTHTLEQPFTWEGETYEEFVFQYGRLTGRDMLNIEREMAAMNEMLLSPEFSMGFAYRVAAKAAGVSSSVIENLPIGDFNVIRREAKNFMTRR